MNAKDLGGVVNRLPWPTWRCEDITPAAVSTDREKNRKCRVSLERLQETWV